MLGHQPVEADPSLYVYIPTSFAGLYREEKDKAELLKAVSKLMKKKA